MYELNKTHKEDCITALKNLAADSVDLILTDIPYDKVNRPSGGLRNLDKKDADVLTFPLDDFIKECVRVCKGSIYIFCSTEQVSQLRQGLVDQKLTTRHCIWNKTSPSPMNGQYMWLSSIENCIFARKKQAVFNEHCKGSVWNYASERSKIHPTQKPLKLFEYLVSVSSNENMLVLDPCMGSGTTALAALKNKRNYLGFDISQEYVDAANKRIVDFKIADYKFDAK